MELLSMTSVQIQEVSTITGTINEVIVQSHDAILLTHFNI
jgi:hypothetical protein